jgi:hypothetical protein
MERDLSAEARRAKVEGSGRAIVFFLALALGVSLGAQASSGEKYIGAWTGTWDGAGSGTFEMTLDKATDATHGSLTGRVEVGTDGGNYNAAFRTLAFDGPKMTARYDFPLDPSAEIVVTATFEDTAAKGTWAMRPKGQEGDLAAGTFAVTRK